jgi:hypothetical protein
MKQRNQLYRTIRHARTRRKVTMRWRITLGTAFDTAFAALHRVFDTLPKIMQSLAEQVRQVTEVLRLP